MKDSIFVWLPRTGGKSVYEALSTQGMCAFTRRREMKSKFENSGMATFGHTDIKALKDEGIISGKYWDSSFKFCFIRDPYKRFLSLLNHNRQKKYNIEDVIGMLESGITPIGGYNLLGLSGFNPQSRWIVDDSGKIIVDYIGRTETINEDFTKVCDLIGIPEKPNLPHLNASARRFRKLGKVGEDFVDEFYKDDFNLLKKLGNRREMNGPIYAF